MNPITDPRFRRPGLPVTLRDVDPELDAHLERERRRKNAWQTSFDEGVLRDLRRQARQRSVTTQHRDTISYAEHRARHTTIRYDCEWCPEPGTHVGTLYGVIDRLPDPSYRSWDR